MNFLESIGTTMENANKNYGIAMSKNDVFMEDVMSELEINIKKCNLRVMQESGTFDDLMYLEAGAVEEAKGKIGAAIDHVKSTLEKFFLKINTAITSKINEVKGNKIVEEFKSKIKFSPKIRNKTVEVIDGADTIKKLDAVKAELAKLVAKIRSGASVPADAIAECGKRIAEITSSASKTVSMSVNKAVDKIGTMAGSMKSTLQKLQSDAFALIDEAKSAAGKVASETSAHLREIAKHVSDIAREGTNATVNTFKSLIEKVKGALTSTGNTVGGAVANVAATAARTLKKESVSPIDDLSFEIEDTDSVVDEDAKSEHLEDYDDFSFESVDIDDLDDGFNSNPN